MRDPALLASLALLFDERLFDILNLPKVTLYVNKRRRLSQEEFQEFRELIKELGASWDPGRRSWKLIPSFRIQEAQRVEEIIEKLKDLAEFVVEVNGKEEKVYLDGDSIVSALMFANEELERKAKELKGRICFRLMRLGAEKFKELLKYATYDKLTKSFCLDVRTPVPRELVETMFYSAADTNAILAAFALLESAQEGSVIFEGNTVLIKMDPQKLKLFAFRAESYEECDLRSPEIEKERRENALSYCEYKWVNEGGELQLVGVPRRLYELGDEWVRVYRGLYKRALRLIDEEPKVLFNDKMPEETSQDFLRDYQREAVNSALKLLRIQGAATIQAATGAGKTEMAVALVKDLMDKGIIKKVFFLSLNRTLNIQAAERFRKYGIEAGLVDSENFQIDKPVVACTVQTLYKSLEKLGKARKVESEKVEDVLIEGFDLGLEKSKKLVNEYLRADMIVVDEVQHVPARTVAEVIQANPFSLRLGLSATPWRDDGRDVMIYALIGDIAERRIYSSELIAKGYLVPVEIYMWQRKLEVDEEMKDLLRGLQGAQKYAKLKNFVFYNDKRNEEIAEIVRVAPKPVLVLTKEIKHANEIFKKIKEKGISAMVLTGKESSVQRETALRLIKEEKLDALVATTLADEGLDLPPLRTLVLAAGGRSQTRTLQRIGRVTRPYPGKKVGIVVDIWDDDREVGGIFYRQGQTRAELYKIEKLWKVRRVKEFKDLLRHLVKHNVANLKKLLGGQ
ncbi:hypothetical protein IPA_01395 [Ignicoccus pacificus DSM 13166]|uniref:Uncharacterized protein n=1 Tax=Ignicoccus pacificus DSM 13166 TaxID=940294 RepID=A0A977KAI3_9CREN|nr:hypothetical protein IPA_01395 [Ignicoccus pacificus DSM 13166]